MSPKHADTSLPFKSFPESISEYERRASTYFQGDSIDEEEFIRHHIKLIVTMKSHIKDVTELVRTYLLSNYIMPDRIML